MPKKDQLRDLDALDGLRVLGRSAMQNLLRLDAGRLIPLVGVGGVCYCLRLQPNSPTAGVVALLCVTVITLVGILVRSYQGWGGHARRDYGREAVLDDRGASSPPR